MPLRIYQAELELNRLYEVSKKNAPGSGEQINPSIWINSGSVNIYTSQSPTAPTSLSQMTLNAGDTNVRGLAVSARESNTIPNYIAIVQNIGSTTEIIASGYNITDLGDIA